MKKFVFTLLLYFVSFSLAVAQDIEVKKFEQLVKDQTAVTSPRKDINGNACGLVKVALKEAGAEFEGSVMGDVEFTGNEYLVYMPNGSKRLGIKHPDYLPTTIVFADYGTRRIASSTTYELRVKTNKKQAKVDNSKKGMAVFNIKPSNAMLLIDGQIADGSSGAYTLSLPYGTHYYTVKIKDFGINNQAVKIDKTPKNINVDLTEFFAKVDVSCLTEDAEISVNGEQKGVGKWGGMVAPGKYTIDVAKDGCHPQTRQIELQDNDTLKVDFPKLKTITGSLRVNYEPKGSDVLLNGKKVGVTPLVLKELPVGDYQLEIWKEYYVKEFTKVKIREDQEWKERGELKKTEFGLFIVNAKKDILGPSEISDGYSALDLADYYRHGAAFDPDGEPWYCEKDTFIISINPIEGVRWLKKLANADNRISSDLKDCMLEYKTEEAISFCLALKDFESKKNWLSWSYEAAGTYVCLAWHYFYGKGCNKDVNKAISLMREACPNGEYKYPAFKKFVKELGLDNELKYNPNLQEERDEIY